MLKFAPIIGPRRTKPPMPVLPSSLLKPERTFAPTEERVRPIRPSESPMDRLWRCLHDEAACCWADLEVRRVTFWFQLTEHFGNGCQPVRADRLRVRAFVGAKSCVLSSAPSTPHESLISYTYQYGYTLRTDLPDPLFGALQDLYAGKPVNVTLRITRLTPSRGKAVEIGSEHEIRIVRASPMRTL